MADKSLIESTCSVCENDDDALIVDVERVSDGKLIGIGMFVLCFPWPMQTEGKYKIWRVVEEDKK